MDVNNEAMPGRVCDSEIEGSRFRAVEPWSSVLASGLCQPCVACGSLKSIDKPGIWSHRESKVL